MYPVNFEKARAQKFLDCLGKNKSIRPEDEIRGWTLNEILELAGTCFFIMRSRTPVLQKTYAERMGRKLNLPEHPEHKEAAEEGLRNDIHAAIEFVGNLSLFIQSDKYDEWYDELLQFGTTQQGQMVKTVVPLMGFKKHSDTPWNY